MNGVISVIRTRYHPFIDLSEKEDNFPSTQATMGDSALSGPAKDRYGVKAHYRR